MHADNHAGNTHCRARGVAGPYAVAVMLTAGLLFSQAVRAADEPATAVLVLETTVGQGTCDYSVPPSVPLGSVIPADFAATGGSTVRTAPFDVRLSNCTGSPGAEQRPGLVFMGTVLSDNRAVFTDDPGKKVGFLFREGHYTGDLSAFWGRPEDTGVVTAGEISGQSQFQKGKVPADGTVIPYTVGFVADGRPGTGNVKATVTIQISYR